MPSASIDPHDPSPRRLERTITLGNGRQASVRWLAAISDDDPTGQLTVRVRIDDTPYIATISRASWDAPDDGLAAAVEQALRRGTP